MSYNPVEPRTTDAVVFKLRQFRSLDLGTFSPFLYAFREREKILDLFEEACGARLTYSYLTPGGATADLPKGWLQKCSAFLDQFEPVIQEYHALLTTAMMQPAILVTVLWFFLFYVYRKNFAGLFVAKALN